MTSFSKNWISRILNEQDRTQKYIKKRITKKKIRFYGSFSTPSQKKKYFRFFIIKHCFAVILRLIQLLKRLLGSLTFNHFKKLYKIAYFNKNRLYLFNFIKILELRLVPILYNSYLLSKISLIKYFLQIGFVLVNCISNSNSDFQIKVTDIISIPKHIMTNSHKNKNVYLRLQKYFRKFQRVKYYSLRWVKHIFLAHKLTLLKKNSLCSSFLKKFLFRNKFYFKNYYSYCKFLLYACVTKRIQKIVIINTGVLVDNNRDSISFFYHTMKTYFYYRLRIAVYSCFGRFFVLFRQFQRCINFVFISDFISIVMKLYRVLFYYYMCNHVVV